MKTKELIAILQTKNPEGEVILSQPEFISDLTGWDTSYESLESVRDGCGDGVVLSAH